jgi:hypothetical protein
MIFVVTFIGYYGIALFHLIRKRKTNFASIQTICWYARVLAIVGVVSTLGYFGYIMFTNHPGSVIFGRPAAWLILQIFSFLTCALTILLLYFLRKSGSLVNSSERVMLITDHWWNIFHSLGAILKLLIL